MKDVDLLERANEIRWTTKDARRLVAGVKEKVDALLQELQRRDKGKERKVVESAYKHAIANLTRFELEVERVTEGLDDAELLVGGGGARARVALRRGKVEAGGRGRLGERDRRA